MSRAPTRPEKQLIRALHRRRRRLEAGLCLVEGPRLVKELLESSLAIELVVFSSDGMSDEDSRTLARRVLEAGIETREVADVELARLSDAMTPQGVLAVARTPRPDWHDLDPARIVVLDAVQDPGNLGTVVRTAEAMAMGGVVCLEGTVDPWSPKAVRASAGSSFRLPVLCAPWDDVCGWLDSAGVEIWVADPRGEPYRRGDPIPPRLALVLGNEGRGVSPRVSDAAARHVSLPLAGRVESLNVGVAGAVLMDRMLGESDGSE